MVYDRTIEDVKEAREIVKSKIQKFLDLTEQEIETLKRGFVTIDTLNRIEDQQGKLKIILNEMGYHNTPIINKNWQYQDIFSEDDLNRIVQNTITLKKAFFVFFDSPENPTARYYFDDFNRMEKILYDLEDMSNRIKENYLICGTFECGEVH